jgi:AraC-like DNA-binding protein
MKAFHEVRSYDSNFFVWHCAYENIGFLGHWHKELEFIYLRSGSANICVNNQTYPMEAGDLVFCDSGDIHYSNSYEMEHRIEFLVVDPQIIANGYQYSNFASPLFPAKKLAACGLTGQVEALFSQIPEELKRKEPFYQEIVRAKLRCFWYLLKRNIPNNPTPAIHNGRSELFNDLQRLLFFLEEHYAENITLEQAAHIMHFSNSHFSKTFKKLTGIHFVTYVNRIRVEHASELIRSSSGKMTEISLRCGFSNIRTFNRVFKEITGFTPSQFARLSEAQLSSVSYSVTRSDEERLSNQQSKTLIQKPL